MRISDWSSDVCSSDLFAGGIAGFIQFGAQLAQVRGELRRLEAMFAGEVVNRAEPMFQLCQALRIQIEPFDDTKRAVGRLADLGAGGFGDVERLEIGRASRRERGVQYVESSVVADSLKKKKIKI